MSQDVLIAGAAGLLGAWVMLKLWVGRPLPTVTDRQCDAYKVLGYRNAIGNQLHSDNSIFTRDPIAEEVYDGMRREYKTVVNANLGDPVIPNHNPWPQI
jgi:hypothetical protein